MAEIAPKPKRGRPPGSKNKVQSSEAAPKTQAAGS
jgi:hypothetical protein